MILSPDSSDASVVSVDSGRPVKILILKHLPLVELNSLSFDSSNILQEPSTFVVLV